MPRTNIILFGESGSGKSSIVNMLSTFETAARISNGATGCTFESKGFEADILGRPVTLWDTVGLGEGDAARVPNIEAVIKLYKLLRNLQDGVSLLMFVMRAPRIRSSARQNWKLFQDIICQGRVPTVIVITGLEQEEDMDQWWLRNIERFRKDEIIPAGYACITASRGRALRRGNGFVFDEIYEESREKVRNLILSTAFITSPWHVSAPEWFKTTINTITEYEPTICFMKKAVKREEEQKVNGAALRKLVSVCNMSEDDARELAERLEGVRA